MLAFDYSPAFLNQESLIRSQMCEPSLFLDAQRHPCHEKPHYHQQPRRVVRSRSCQPRSYQPRYATKQDYLQALLNQLVDHEEKPIKPEVASRVVNTKDFFQIQIRKTDGDFKHYSIRYEALGRDVVIYVESKVDEFAKGFKFEGNAIDINNVQWKVSNNVLAVDVPKSNEQFVFRPAVRRRSAETPKQPSPKPVQKPIQKPRTISIPVEFGDSETEISATSTRSNSRRSSVSESNTPSTLSTPSESGVQPDAELSEDETTSSNSKLPKMTRKVSIEEVEDECLHMEID